MVSGGKKQTQWVRGGSSYISRSDIRVTFGLGEAAGIDHLEVRWPRSRRQEFGALPGNRFYWLREGGKPGIDPRCASKKP